jgi:uncharacterized protein YecE (DUF72 family)
MRSGRILVGTASWSDPEFVRDWYPAKMPAGERLGWYAQQFEMVEVNSSFYSVPEPRMVARWCSSTPAGFVFNFKLHQLLSRHSTQAKLLPPPLQQTARLDDKGRVQLTAEIESQLIACTIPGLEVFGRAGKLGVLLLQLSPAFSPRKHQLDELDLLLGELRRYRVAIEFRNRHWAVGEQLDETLAFLRQHGAAFVNVDAPRVEHFTIMPPEIDAITAPEAAYLRLHGRDARAYTTGKTVASRFHYDYSDAEIEEIAQRSRKLAAETQEAYIVFNNNSRDYAPHAAARLRVALGQALKSPPRTGELF